MHFVYSFSERKDRPVRERLMKLMKSDEIRINDSHYMRRLSKQIERSYEVKANIYERNNNIIVCARIYVVTTLIRNNLGIYILFIFQ